MLAKFVLRSCCRTSLSSLEIVIKAFFIEKVISSGGDVGWGAGGGILLMHCFCDFIV